MKPTPVPGIKHRKRSAWRVLVRVAAAAIAAPVLVLVLLYAVLLVTPIPLPFVSQQVRNIVVGMMPAGSQLELGEMALALEDFVWPVIQFSPVVFTDVKTGGTVTMEALEVGFSPVRALVGQPGATITIVGPHLQVNQDIFGPRLAKFELVDEADGSHTVRVIEGQDEFPDVALSKEGLDVRGTVPDPKLGIRSDNDWLIYNLEAAGEGIAGIIQQARNGSFSKLVVRGGTLDMNDALYGVFRTFKDITLDIAPASDAKSAAGSFSVAFGATVMHGMVEWLEGEDDTGRLKASITNFDPAAFSPMVGDTSAPATVVGSMSVSMDIGFAGVEKRIADGLFHLDMTGMDVKTPNGYEPVATSIAEVRWDPALGQFTMEETQVSVGNNTAYVKGVFRLGLDTQYGPTVSISLTGRDISLASDLGPPTEPFTEMSLAAWSAPLYGATGIDQFEIRKADGSQIAARGRVDMLLDGAGFDMTIAGDGISADDLKRVWPPFLATQSRDWFVKNVVGGRLKGSSMRYDFPVGSIDLTAGDQPLPPGAITIDIVGEDVEIKAVDTMAPVRLEGDTHLTMRDASVTISADGATIPTEKGTIAVANVAFVIGSDGSDTTVYEISGDLSSGVPALVALAKSQQAEALAKANLPLDLDTLTGNVTLSLVSTIAMDRHTDQLKSLDYAINGVAQDLGSTAQFDGHTVGNGQLSFVASQAGYRVVGQGQIDGITADVTVDGKLGGESPPAPTVLLSTTVSAADLKKMGVDASQFLSGSVSLVAKPMPDGTIQVALDLGKAGLTIKDLGITKAVGVAGEAQAAIKLTGDVAEVSQVDIGFGDVRLKGGIEFDLKKGLKAAEFSTLKLSPDDDAQLTLTPLKDGYQIKLRGNQLDLKPMLQRFFSLSGDSTGGPQATAIKQTIEVDAELKRALGFYKTTAFNVNLDLALRGADLQRVSLQANLGGDRSVSVTTNKTPDGKVMSVAFNDLGTLLRLMNIYPNIEGGEGSLVVQTIDAEKIDKGQFALRRFAFVNEQNVGKILGNHQESRAMISRSNKLEFRSGEVDFVRRKDRVEITDAVLAGDTVGGTARGFIYTDNRQYDITGTYVPLFGLNNAFAKLLGPLAGRDGEGLFGVTFAIRGELDKPDFKINPMSALVPGAFRRMFEYRAKEIPRVE
ncbi:hypothetical protein [Devosia sp.]|uniref:hypothetical protein n=1 Tax=Devosia sp. TaxID=1871048 RepID=UPI0035B4F9EB